jgi:hypothetical protein
MVDAKSQKKLDALFAERRTLQTIELGLDRRYFDAKELVTRYEKWSREGGKEDSRLQEAKKELSRIEAEMRENARQLNENFERIHQV